MSEGLAAGGGGERAESNGRNSIMSRLLGKLTKSKSGANSPEAPSSARSAPATPRAGELAPPQAAAAAGPSGMLPPGAMRPPSGSAAKQGGALKAAQGVLSASAVAAAGAASSPAAAAARPPLPPPPQAMVSGGGPLAQRPGSARALAALPLARAGALAAAPAEAGTFAGAVAMAVDAHAPFARARGASLHKPPSLVCEFSSPAHQQRPSLIAAMAHGGGGGVTLLAAAPMSVKTGGDSDMAEDPTTPTAAEPRYHSAEAHPLSANAGSIDGLTGAPPHRPGVDHLQARAMPEAQRRVEALATHVDAAKRRQDAIDRLRDLEAQATAAAAASNMPAAAGAAPSTPAAAAQKGRESVSMGADDYEAQRSPGRVGGAGGASPPARSPPRVSPTQTAAKSALTVAIAAGAAAPPSSTSPRPSPHSPSAASPSSSSAPAKPKRAYKLLSVHALLHPAMRREFWASDQFEVTKRLHKGYASEVYKATCKQSGEACAVKVYDVTQLGKLNKAQLIREIKLHGSFAHRNIVELWCSFQEGNQVALVQKFAEQGDLLKMLNKCGGRMNERAAVQVVIHPLLTVLLYLHARGVTHRDIKPENILFDEEGVLKLADFGLAINMNEEAAVTRAGTLHYMAPEVLACPLKDDPEENKEVKRLHYTSSVDTWAVGCLAYELTVGFPPFIADKTTEITARIQQGQVQYPSKMGEEQRNFVQWALQRSPQDRPTVAEMLQHPWITLHQKRTSLRNLGGSGDGGSGSASAAARPVGASRASSARHLPAGGAAAGAGGSAAAGEPRWRS